MDDKEEKSIVGNISDAMKGVVDTASAAAMKAMEPKLDPKKVAGTTNEQVYIPEATDAVAMPAPLFAAPAKKHERHRRNRASGQLRYQKVNEEIHEKKATKRTATKTTKKPAKKVRAKKTKSSTGRKKKEGEAVRMEDAGGQIEFNTSAVLRKWPSLKNERVSATLGARPYLVVDGTLDECIRQFMSKPASQHHLYEIHTAPQEVDQRCFLSTEQIIELARLRDFL